MFIIHVLRHVCPQVPKFQHRIYWVELPWDLPNVFEFQNNNDFSKKDKRPKRELKSPLAQ